MDKIKRVSHFFKIIFIMLLIAIPVLEIIGWTTSPESLVLFNGFIQMSFIPSAYIATASHPSQILHELTMTDRLLGLSVSAVPALINMFIVYCLIKLFQLYENGEIFSITNVNYIKRIGYALILGELVNPICQGLMGVVLTWDNPPGHGFFAITLDQTNFAIIFMALLVILISWIMAEGCKLREEQQLTI